MNLCFDDSTDVLVSSSFLTCANQVTMLFGKVK